MGYDGRSTGHDPAVHPTCRGDVTRLRMADTTATPMLAASVREACSRTEDPTLFVKQRFPVRRHRSGWSGYRLIRRMRLRGVKLRTVEEFLRTIVIKPMLAGLEARDDRVTRSGVVFRCVLTW